MDALDLLEQQHRDVSDLLNRIAVERSAGRRGFLVAHLVRLIDAHARVEERVFYPACAEQLRGGHERLYDGCEEHALTRFAAAALLRTRATSVRFEARLRLVRHLFLRHAHEEEHSMFPKVKRDLTDEQLDVMGNDIDRAFRFLLSLDQPDTKRSKMSHRLESTPALAAIVPMLAPQATLSYWDGATEGAEEAGNPDGDRARPQQDAEPGQPLALDRPSDQPALAQVDDGAVGKGSEGQWSENGTQGMKPQRVLYLAMRQGERGASHPAARARQPRRDREGAEGNSKHRRTAHHTYDGGKARCAAKGARSAAG
jgi:hypothetical protein